MATTTLPRKGARGMLALEEAAAWSEYLESTNRVEEFRYEDVEPWAWARLQRRLKVIGARRKALR